MKDKEKTKLDKKLQRLNFIYVDLKLNFEKIDKISNEDAELMKSIDEEKEEKRKNMNKKLPRKSVQEGLPEIRAVKIYKKLVSEDPRLHNLSMKQCV